MTLKPTDSIEAVAASLQAGAAKYAGMRQYAKQANFGTPPSPPPVDGMSPGECLRRFEAMQRESPEFRAARMIPSLTNAGLTFAASGTWLTPAQLACAKMMWQARVGIKVRETEAEDAERERTQVVCDDDRWEP